MAGFVIVLVGCLVSCLGFLFGCLCGFAGWVAGD